MSRSIFDTDTDTDFDAGQLLQLARRPESEHYSGRGSIWSIWPYRLTRWGLAAVFLTAGARKLMDPGSLAVVIDAYGIVPGAWSMPIAVSLAALETLAAIGLLFEVRGALTVITGLLVLFIAILGYGLFLGLDVDCGCFGPGNPEAEAFHGMRSALYRDLVMLAAVAYLYVWRLGRTEVPLRPGPILRADPFLEGRSEP